MEPEPYRQAAAEAVREVARARGDLGVVPFNSAHEGYAVLLEEVDELWGEVKVNGARRDMGKMRKEAVQVAAMALVFIAECTGEPA